MLIISFLNTGQQTVSAGASSFIVNCNPLFASLIGFYILKQKVRNYFWFGIFGCIVGVLIISLESHHDFSFNQGVLYILIAAILTSSYFHIIKPLVNKYGALTTFCFTLLFGTIPMLFWLNNFYSFLLFRLLLRCCLLLLGYQLFVLFWVIILGLIQ